VSRAEHYSVNFERNEDGWYVPECVCGWKWAAVPDAEDAADALMQHAREQGYLEAQRDSISMLGGAE